MSILASGQSSCKGILAMQYRTQEINIDIVPLNGTPLLFKRVVGQHRIFMSYGSFTWSFSLRGGTNSTCSQVMPMYPSSGKNTYDPNINYALDQESPRGCIVNVEPIPQNTTRINVFTVKETLTGSDLEFIFSYSPFTSIDSTVVCKTPIEGTLNMKIVYHRSTQKNFDIPVSFGAPYYITRDFYKLFESDGFSNPLDANIPLSFKRYNGQQNIVVENLNTGFYFSFYIDVGVARNALGYIGATTDPALNCITMLPSSENCTIEILPTPSPVAAAHQVKLRVSTPADYNRVYIFSFLPDTYSQSPPTIQLESGDKFVDENIVVHLYARYFTKY